MKYYLTTAIAYVNSPPHVGFAYEVIAADAMARFQRLAGRDVFFLTGSDEHSINVEKKARAEGLEPKAYCDRMVEMYKEVWKELDISYDCFVRTTDPSHERAVKLLVAKIQERGDIYRGTYEGWYCVSCEAYYHDGDLVDGKCPVHKREPQWLKEENYFFALSRYGERLTRLLKDNPEFVRPEARRNEMLNILEGGLEDVSISRSGVAWGVPFPNDPGHVIWVWFDALTNYISAVGYGEDTDRFSHYWPADLHLIGKDITRLHLLLWPALLMAAGLELPRRIFSHGFISLEGEKMSKTRGHLVDPRNVVRSYGADALRYFLLREIPFGQDGDYSESSFRRRFNSDLANDLGNLLSRVITMAEKYTGSFVPEPSSEQEPVDMQLVSAALDASRCQEGFFENLEFSAALAAIWQLVSRANRYVEETAPWTLAKDASAEKRIRTVLYNLLESLRIVSVLISPFMPGASSRMREQLGVAKDAGELKLDEAKHWGLMRPGTRLTRGDSLFPRLAKKGDQM